MKKKIALNMIFSFILQVVNIINGFIVPKLIIQTFGSETNGLVSSLNQLLNYISLLEGGVASVMMASLYKPLIEGNNEKLSSIMVTMKSFFKKLSFVFLIYMIILATSYYYLISNTFSWDYIFFLTIILGINLFFQYNISISYKLLLNADNKIYLTSAIQSIIVILNIIAVYISIKIFPSIHLVKFITMFIFLLQPFCFSYLVNKKYNLNKNVKKDNNVIKQRWDGFGINLAYFIHNNTDITLLSVFSSLSTVSVYSVYMIVINGIKSILNAILSSFVPSFGKILASNNKENANNYFDTYEFISISISIIFFSIGLVLIVPFVSLYTKGIDDANYIQPLFAIIMIFGELFYCIRDPYINAAYQSGKFKEISKYAYIEAFINIMISLLFVKLFGLLGVAIGTLISIVYRTIMQVLYLKNNVLNRRLSIFFKYICIYMLVPMLTYLISYNYKFIFDNDIIDFIVLGFESVFISIVTYIFLTFIFYKKKIYKVISMIKRKEEKNV